MNEFRSLNYCTVYQSEGDVTHSFREDCCFHTVTVDDGSTHMNNTYTIVFFKEFRFSSQTGNNNTCILEEKQIRNYLRIIQNYYPFAYTLKTIDFDKNYNYEAYVSLFNDDDNEINSFPAYELKVTLSGHMMAHKLVLKMIRALYEYPFNMYLYDILKLRQLPKFKKYNTFNLYLLVGCLNYLGGCYANDDQFISSFGGSIPNFFTRKGLLSKLDSVGNNEYIEYSDKKINDIYNYVYLSQEKRYEIRQDFELLYNNYKCFDYEYWLSPELFAKRVKLYSKYIKLFKR